MDLSSKLHVASAQGPWLAAWPAGVVIGVANGILREATYGRCLNEQAAHQLSGVTGIGAFAAVFCQLQRRWPIQSTRQALRIGAGWLLLTLAFEFGFGRTVAKESWEELVSDYPLAKGRTWPLVLAWITLGLAVVRRLQIQHH